MIQHFVKSLIVACVLSGIASCSMMTDEEKLDGCPTGDFVVQFVYDYNIQRADMFRDHVGEIALYVFDENGKFVTQREISDKDIISNRDKRCQIIFRAGDDPNDPKVELLAGGKYQFVAIAGQRKDAIIDTDEALPVSIDDAERARYRHSHYGVSSHEDDLRVALDRSATPDEFGRYAVNSNAPLDTLWHTLGILYAGQHSTDDPKFNGWRDDPLVKIRENIYDFDNIELHSPEDTLTISLIRNTKHLHVALKELDKPAEVNADDYEVYIEDANGLMNVHNEVLPDQHLIYRPYHQRTTDESDAYLDNEEGVKYTAAHWDMMFNRIIYHDNHPEDDARLMIVRKSDNEVVAKLSLPRILAYNSIANHYYHLTHQGYLDREYNYNLTFYLKGGKWEETEIWIATDVNVLSWNVRRQEFDLDVDINDF